jgi:hypothetical protein
VATENGTEEHMIDGGFIAKFILKITIFVLLQKFMSVVVSFMLILN